MSIFRVGVMLSAAVALATMSTAQQPELSPQAIRVAIEDGLTRVPRAFERLTSPAQAGVRVLDVAIDRSPRNARRITIDLSQRALTYDTAGSVEMLIDSITASLARTITTETELRLLVDGLPLDRLLAAPAPRYRAQDVVSRSPIVISAGHGAYWNENLNRWILQRDYYWGIVEDFVNWDMTRYLLDELAGRGIDARPARTPDRNAAEGPSGLPSWEEGAKYFIRTVGAPSDVSDYGANEYNRDINSRPFYANWIDAAAMVSIHNNGGSSTGTETWYDETNGWADESRRLAEIIQGSVVRAIRESYDPNWVDRGLRSCNGCKGETRLAARPAVILEGAFMDMQSPDNTALHDDVFKRLVAQAVAHALETWRAQSGTH
jgi:N-acetylmuramoyl-L-alanine amidase